ncbi:MAG: DNA recombination protein RmuC, partial [Pseudomonadota bacterium]
PSLLMLSIQVIQALLKDARMREQAHLIQAEVIKLVEDLGRLDDRVRKLQTHFGQANNDIEQILVSTNKIGKRGRKIETMDFEPSETAKAIANPDEETPSAESASGQLRLRVVEGEDTASAK